MAITHVWGNSDPLWAELYNVEELLQLAKQLAEFSAAITHRSDYKHRKLLGQNLRSLHDLHHHFSERSKPGVYQPPVQEWFLDNFHLIVEQAMHVSEDLSPRFYAQLPVYISGPLEGQPRAYELALQLVAHVDSQIDSDILKRFLDAYQSSQILTTGELWAVPIFARLVLIENITRLVKCAYSDCRETDAADELLETFALNGKAQESSFATFDKTRLVKLVSRMREKRPELFVQWKETITQDGKNLEDLFWIHNQELARTRVSIGNAITSLRILASIDWPEFIDSISAVDQILRKDPAGAYEKCDFNTRDRYRHTVEQIARHSKASETEVAELAVTLAEKSESGTASREAHVGFYLIAEGRESLERAVQFEAPLGLSFRRAIRKHATLYYLGFISFLTLLLTAFVTLHIIHESENFFLTLLAFVLVLIPASAIAVVLTNWLVTFIFGPEYMPRLETKDGIPKDSRTMVVLPILLTTSKEIEELLSRLEIHYLSNPDDNLEFALLADFVDADTATSANDGRLLQQAIEGIEQLNRNYPASIGSRFHVFHRRRKWNPVEEKWMGWERKRGKLEEFNRLLLGKNGTSFEPAPIPSNIRFVITLDADTTLPRDAANKLVGILSHPLNRPVIDPASRKVTTGYGILQPRVSHTLSSANASLFARAFSGPSGIDPYTRAVSDVYQDLFDEASFIGKGIYDLKAFHDCLEGRFPENTLLSHDLVEGAFARTGLVSDVELFDDHPSDYTSYSIRNHRWTRGDWQAAFWWLRSRGDKTHRLSTINAWKLMDNIRRSLVIPFVLLLFLLGWTVLPGGALFWSLFSTIVVSAPIFIPLTNLFAGAFRGVPLLEHVTNVLHSFRAGFFQTVLSIIFLANDALFNVDAIVRTLFRIKRKKLLLEWTTAAQAERYRSNNIAVYHRRMWVSPVLALVAIPLINAFTPESWRYAAPLVMAWLLAPSLAFLTGLKIEQPVEEVSSRARQMYRSYARECWRFFDTFVTEENHWLPVDNFQEDPAEAIAHRTSPTNIGFSLLANVCAFDLGYIGIKDFLRRTEMTLATITRLSTFNGHLFNWYDTRTLEPLEPRYVSTVDSGNLASALLTVRQFVSSESELLSAAGKRLEGMEDQLYGLLVAAKSSGQSRLVSEIRKVHKEVHKFVKRPHSDLAEEDLFNWLDTVLSEIGGKESLNEEMEYWLRSAQRTVTSHLSDFERPQDLSQWLRSIARDAETLMDEMDFRFLFDEDRGLFSIGFNVTYGRMDASYYDLLASESRLTSFMAIAKRDVPQSHWFRMGRTTTSRGPSRLLVSWSGSMFEYLMPLLLMRNEPGTILDYSYLKAVEVQKSYGHRRRVPWGISESAYNHRDAALNYQYGPFGVPSLGLKRALDADLVIAPYASFLAAMVEPNAAQKNLEALERLGARGRFGFFESIDFTPERVPEGERFVIVKTFMTHHIGMSLVALDNILNHRIMQKRFHADPLIQAIDILVQERMPVSSGFHRMLPVDERPQLYGVQEPVVAREFHTPYLTPPRVQILSNGKLSLLISTSGSGYAEWNGIRVNRWIEDPTCDATGIYFFLKKLSTGTVWSAAFQPVRVEPDNYGASFFEDRVEFRRRDGAIETQTDIVVSPDDNSVMHKLTLVNTSADWEEFEITSYSEVILTSQANDIAHRTFSSLFVQTEFIPELQALIAWRPADSRNPQDVWAAQVCVLEHENDSGVEYETDRLRFLGRNNPVARPANIVDSMPLSGTTGAVLDPIFSLRRKIRIAPYSREVLAFITMIGSSRDEIVSLIHRYREYRAVMRAFELASAHAQVTLQQFSISREDADLFQRLAGRLIFSNRSLRPRPAVLARNKRTQASLWQFGISGDLPICIVRIEDESELSIVRQMLKAHEYWRRKGLLVDLVILNEYPSSYFQDLEEQIQLLIRAGSTGNLLNQPGGIFVLRKDQIGEEEWVLLRTVARVEIHPQRGTLPAQLLHTEDKDPLPQPLGTRSAFPIDDRPCSLEEPRYLAPNGFGGFTEDGQEYRIRISHERKTPAPWINVISNPEFGFQVSENGGGMTWSINSRENRLTPFSNDPVADPVECTIYLRDEESGHFWTATPRPAPGNGDYQVAHGAGYSVFENGSFGIEQKLTMFVPVSSPIKLMQLRVKNRTRRTRELSATFYAELVLGVDRQRTAHYVVSSVDGETGTLLFRNPYNTEFPTRIAFIGVNDIRRTLTADRTEFLGPCGSMEDPAALHRQHLSGRTGPGLDPCGAIHTRVKLSPFQEHTFVFVLGEGTDVEEVRALVRRYTKQEATEEALRQVRNFWNETLQVIQIDTPDPRFNVMMNRWLLYQALSCRFWGRTALYQSGGAYGFRDQLQDALAIAYAHPNLLHDHLLLAASRQFVEGDVQHWWHPPSGKGVRTRISDDLLWLPYCTAFYVSLTGDSGILEKKAAYLQGPLLPPDASEHYFQPEKSENEGTLYEHCIRAIDHSLRFGEHGLPLIGGGDWNDGLNQVGLAGRGESVWLAWFLIKVLNDFVVLCEGQQDWERAKKYRDAGTTLTSNVHDHAWDGEWFLRCFHDNGTWMGSAKNVEGKIDSIAQSWSVLSGAGDPEKSGFAMQSVKTFLINHEDQLALLFTPPYGQTSFDPGYIRDYPPGIRENGGQYNHAVAWLIAAFCEIGQPDQAYELFQMMNPAARATDVASCEKYRLEPYAVAGDIYSHPNHRGRGGWSWYTGSAAWLYRVGLENILGFQLNDGKISVRPSIPSHWNGFRLRYRQGEKIREIVVERTGNGMTISIDGETLGARSAQLV